MSRLDPGHKHTNASMVKLLGESGYIVCSTPIEAKAPGSGTWSMWERGGDIIWLVQYRDQEPELRGRKEPFPIIDPKTLGVRNPNIQQDGSADE